MIQLVSFEGVDYKSSTCHMRVRNARGPAKLQACVDCTGPASDWSRRHDTHPMDPMNYDPRCRSCHWRYDGNVANLAGAPTAAGERNGRTSLTNDIVRKIKERYLAGGISQRALAAEYSTSQPVVSSIVTGSRWKVVSCD